MQMFTVKAVRKPCSWVNGIEAHLDAPAADSSAAPRFFLSVAGWVASLNEPIQQIWIACVGKVLGNAKVFERPDVASAYPDRKHTLGFEIGVIPLGLGASEPLKIMIESASGKRTVLFEIELAFNARDEAPDDASTPSDIVFAPIIALPRSGTTYLGQLLHTSAAVLGEDQYPYELRFTEHFVNEWLASTQPWSYAAPADRNSQTVDPNFATINAILRSGDGAPDDDVFHRGARALLNAGRRYYLDKITQLYRLATPKPKGRIIAEKIGLGVELDLIAALGAPVKPIFLIRDPRDVLLSMRSFNEKRGVYEFHEPRTKHFNDVVFLTSMDLMYLVRRYDQWQGEKLLVRYDQLVKAPQRALRTVLDFLGVPPESAAANKLAATSAASIPDVHITSSSPLDSIGRWKSELTPSEIDMANWYFGSYLERFDF